MGEEAPSLKGYLVVHKQKNWVGTLAKNIGLCKPLLGMIKMLLFMCVILTEGVLFTNHPEFMTLHPQRFNCCGSRVKIHIIFYSHSHNIRSLIFEIVQIIHFHVIYSSHTYSLSLSIVSVIAAFCRNSVDGQWYSYDDSSAEPVPEAEVCTRGAYILFYQRRNTIPPWSASSSVTG